MRFKMWETVQNTRKWDGYLTKNREHAVNLWKDVRPLYAHLIFGAIGGPEVSIDSAPELVKVKPKKPDLIKTTETKTATVAPESSPG